MESTDVVARRCSVKKVLLDILQNSQENTCARGSFLIKLKLSARPEQNIPVMPNWSKTFQTFWSHSSVFVLKNNMKSSIFIVFLPVRNSLVASFNERRAPTSRKYVVEQALPTPNWSKKFQTFWSHFSVFALENYSKNLNFWSILASKRTLCGTYALTFG